MHRFRFRGLRAGALFLLLTCGAAFGFAKDSHSRYTGAAVVALGVAFVLYLVLELNGPEDARSVSGGAAAEQPPHPVRPPAADPTGPALADTADEASADSPDLDICDLCGRVESRTGHDGYLDLPEGWLALEIDRRAAEVLYRTYCCEDHMRQGLARALPTPEPLEREPAWTQGPRTVRDRLAQLAWSAGMLLLTAFLLLGSGLALRFLIGLL
ncbi:hypothetical protein [Saccharothrix sp. ST-888]|uniref:hypothetical protein n=1 Tax=Saccharothrix sp. ST-888 TaxID=1427391 RepID=UPI0005EC04D8|nr:hypothetical protein [Saccharothrix sp. ST-888]KJK56552.1 hypothetical protein UK12_21850 [Saccharothrix sp. ST-888]